MNGQIVLLLPTVANQFKVGTERTAETSFMRNIAYSMGDVKIWYKESTAVEKNFIAKFHAHNNCTAKYAITYSICCSVRPSICSCLGLPKALAEPRYGTVSCFMTSLNVGAVGWGHEGTNYRTEVGVPSVMGITN